MFVIAYNTHWGTAKDYKDYHDTYFQSSHKISQVAKWGGKLIELWYICEIICARLLAITSQWYLGQASRRVFWSADYARCSSTKPAYYRNRRQSTGRRLVDRTEELWPCRLQLCSTFYKFTSWTIVPGISSHWLQIWWPASRCSSLGPSWWI